MTNENQLSTPVLTGEQEAALNNGLIKRDNEGKFRRVAQYETYSSVRPTTRAEKVALFNIVNGGDNSVTQLKKSLGKQITVKDVVTNPYDSVDEETGEIKTGVITILFDVSGEVFVTSSKSVYYAIMNAFKVFGRPTEEGYEPIVLEVYEERKGNSRNKSVDLKLIG